MENKQYQRAKFLDVFKYSFGGLGPIWPFSW